MKFTKTQYFGTLLAVLAFAGGSATAQVATLSFPTAEAPQRTSVASAAELAFSQATRQQRSRLLYIEKTEARLADTRADIDRTFGGTLPDKATLARKTSELSAAVRAMEPKPVVTAASVARESRITALLKKMQADKSKAASDLSDTRGSAVALAKFDKRTQAEFTATSEELSSLYAARETDKLTVVADPKRLDEARAELSRYIRFGEYEDSQRLLETSKSMLASDAAAVAAAQAVLPTRN